MKHTTHTSQQLFIETQEGTRGAAPRAKVPDYMRHLHDSTVMSLESNTHHQASLLSKKHAAKTTNMGNSSAGIHSIVHTSHRTKTHSTMSYILPVHNYMYQNMYLNLYTQF